MQLIIHDTDTLQQVQDVFNVQFPNLWINFYRRTAGVSPALSQEKINPATYVKSISHVAGSCRLDIHGGTTVGQLEQNFLKTMGIETRVYRKSSGLWVNTLYTVNWTLDEQNTNAGQIVID